MDLQKLPARADGGFHVVVETPRGSTLKLKYDPKLGVMTLSRPLPAGLTYPFDWGFIPSTKAPDGDPLDAMVLWEHASPSGLVLPCRAVAVVEVEQDSKKGGRERNDRILAVPLEAPLEGAVRDLADVPQRLRDELAHFFLASVAFEKKNAKILGFSGANRAMELLDEATR